MDNTMNLSIEEMNRIWHDVAKQRLRRSRRTRRSNKQRCQYVCIGKEIKTLNPTEVQPVADSTNLPPHGMSAELWYFLNLKQRESVDDLSSSKSGTSYVSTSHMSSEMNADRSLSPFEQKPQVNKMSQSHLSQTEDQPNTVMVEKQQHNQTYLSEESSSDNYVTDELKKVISDAVQRWKETTSGSSLVVPDTIAKIAQEVALNEAQKLSTQPKQPDDIKAKLNQVNQSIEILSPIVNNDVKRCPSMSPVSITPSCSNKKENMLMDYENGSDSELLDKKNLVPIGFGNALVPAYLLKTINWNLYKIATRKLLQAVFGRSVLATHNLTGKASPAFPGRLPKAKLDETLVNDIVQTVAERCGVTENIVRTCITIKCADEGKWLRKEQAKQKTKRKKKQIHDSK